MDVRPRPQLKPHRYTHWRDASRERALSSHSASNLLQCSRPKIIRQAKILATASCGPDTLNFVPKEPKMQSAYSFVDLSQTLDQRAPAPRPSIAFQIRTSTRRDNMRWGRISAAF